MSDLKNCPFCGSDEVSIHHDEDQDAYWIACICNATMTAQENDDDKHVKAAWNRRVVPQANAEQYEAIPEQWSYSTNEESYQGQEDSREAIIQVALSEIGEQSGAFWIAKNKRHTGSGTYVAGSVIEGLQEQAWEECGEFAETFLDDVTKEEEKELADLITDWCKRVDRSNFWTVYDEELLHIEDVRAASKEQDNG